MRQAVYFLVFVYYSFNALLFVGRCHFKGFDKDLRREGGNYCSVLSVFNIFYICVFLIISCFTYDQLFVGRCHFKDFWSEGSRKRVRERVRLSSFVSSAFGVNVKERRSRNFDDNFMDFEPVRKYLLKQGNWVIEFWFELEKYFSLHKKKFRVFLCCLSVSPEYFGLDAFESSQRHERPHQSLFNISDRFCLTKPFYSSYTQIFSGTAENTLSKEWFSLTNNYRSKLNVINKAVNVGYFLDPA